MSKHNCEVHPGGGGGKQSASASSLGRVCKSALNHRGSKERSPRREEGEAGVGRPGGALPTATEEGARPNCGGVAGPGPHSRRGCCGEPWASRPEPPNSIDTAVLPPATPASKVERRLLGLRQALDLCRRKVVRQAQPAQDSYHDKAREHPDDGKHPDGGVYNKGPSYSSYSSYIMMPNMNSDPYMSNGSLSPPIPRTSNKVPVVQPSHAVHPLTPLITYSDEHFSPGSHPSHIPSDVNSKQGMSRHPPAPEIPTFYPLSPGAVGQITPPLGWFSHHMIPGPPGPHTTGIPHPAIVTPQVKQEHPHTDSDLMHVKPQHEQRKEQEPKRPHIKKPLNAFMLYMKEMRANVVAECTLKESAAINQILGRRWHALSREEQAKYYELARKERQLHMQLYPGWSARDNYGKKKKRKREKLQESTSGTGPRMTAAYI